MSEPITYRVAPGRIVWSEKHQKHFHEGEIVDLSHASAADIAAVVASGAIVEVKPESKVKETSHGKA